MEKRKETLLLVDDEPGALKSLEGTLSKLFEQVIIARDGEEALHIIENDDIDILITDMNMPYDGAELIHVVKKDHKKLPVIITTAYFEFIDVYKDIIDIKVLMKPVDIRVLVSTIDEVMATRKCEVENAMESLDEVYNKAKDILSMLRK